MKNQVPLTIGMSVYDDFDGVFFTVQALRMFHQDVKELEIVIIDNNPDSNHGREVANFTKWTNAKYVPFINDKGPWSKFEIFNIATHDHVVCLDSHVFLEAGALRRLAELYAENPNTKDLYQGPLVYDDLKTISTHLAPEWRGNFFGIWATDARAVDRDASPFEIEGQGMGFFSCAKKSFPKINPNFRGFGGEEFYIHDKIRMNGGKCWCVPFLRWLHRFQRPAGVPYRNVLEDRVRNYLIAWSETGRSIISMVDEFSKVMPIENINQIISDGQRQGVIGPLK